MNVTPSPTRATCVEIGDSPISDFLMVVYILAFIFGLIFNVLTFLPILEQVRQKNVLGIFLLSLSVSDMLYIFTMPLWIIYYKQNHKWKLGDESCSVAGFFYYSNMYVSIYLLCCISVDRCLVISYPLHFNARRSSSHAWIQCVVGYVVVMVLHAVLLFNVKNNHNNEDRCYETYPMEKSVAVFNLVRVVFGFLVPLVLLAVSYWKVLAKVGQSPGLSAQVKRKVRLLSYGVIGIFSVCFAPYHILLLTRSIVFFKSPDTSSDGDYCQFEQRMHFLFSCTLALSSLNCIVDPVLYVLVSSGTKDRLLLCCRSQVRTPTEDVALNGSNPTNKHNLI